MGRGRNIGWLRKYESQIWKEMLDGVLKMKLEVITVCFCSLQYTVG